jgi:hypothetical protein
MSRMQRAATLLVLLATCQGAAAQPAPQVQLSYETYAAGLNVLDIRANLQQDAQSYRISVHFNTTGLFGAIFSAHSDTVVQGIWQGDDAEPLQFYSYGDQRGRPRRTLIEYANGDPVVRDLTPPAEEEREPVPPAMEAHTIDTLSAMATLMRHVADTGRCDGSVTTFDGRRVARITAHTVGQEMLARSHGSIYSGPALRCDFQGVQLAGFMRDADQAELRRPQQGVAWFAPLQTGGQPMPVRIAFHTRFFGDAIAYLVRPGR